MRHKVLIYISCVALCLAACTMSTPRVLKVNGHTRVYTERKLCGIVYTTVVETIKTPEQKAEEDQQATESARATIALWGGTILLACAVTCAVIGYLTHGWKRWGGLAVLCGAMGGLCWGFVEWIEYLKWFALALPLVAIGLFLYDNKENGKEE